MTEKTGSQKATTARPPQTAERLLLYVLPEPIRDDVSGDLSEMFGLTMVPRYGVLRARLWYWRQVVCAMGLAFRSRKNPQASLEVWKGRRQLHRIAHASATLHPGISMHHIPVGSGVPGLLFVLATLFIFGVGIPAFLVLLSISGIVGIVVSRLILYWHRHHALDIQPLDLRNRHR
jgi:hypothetical protein